MSLGLGFGRGDAGARAPVTPPSYLGYAATRGNMSDTNYGGGLTSVGGRRMMIVRGACNGFCLKYCNWFWDGTREVACGPATIEASLETPSGRLSRFLFSSTSVGAVAAGAEIVSDPLDLVVPPNSVVWPNWLVNGSHLGLSQTPHNIDAGDRFEFAFGGTVTNRVMTGGWVNGDGSGNTGASGVALLAQTTLPSALILTDSKGWVGDDNNAPGGDRGEIARSIGPAYGYTAMASAGDTLANLAASGAYRRRQAAHASFVASNMSVNSVQALAAFQAQARDFWASREFAGKKLYHTTLTPETTGSFTSDAGQTPKPGFESGGNRDQINAWLRTIPAPLTAVWDTATAVQSAGNPNVWASPGGVALTGDGTHPSPTGYARVASQGVIVPGTVTI